MELDDRPYPKKRELFVNLYGTSWFPSILVQGINAIDIRSCKNQVCHLKNNSVVTLQVCNAHTRL
jgi:hypothetical protein